MGRGCQRAHGFLLGAGNQSCGTQTEVGPHRNVDGRTDEVPPKPTLYRVRWCDPT